MVFGPSFFTEACYFIPFTLKEMCILIDCWIEKLNELNPSLVLYEILQLIRLCCITLTLASVIAEFL